MSLVLRFSFDGPIVGEGRDVSGSAVSAANSGVVAAEDDSYARVALFNGASHLELGGLPASVSDTRCFSLWVSADALSVSLFSAGDGSAPGSLLRVSVNASGQVRVECPGLPDSVSSPSIVPGAWAHLAVSYDGASVKCYVNSALVLDAARGVSTGVSTGAAALNIGGAFDGGASAFEGRMSDFRLYNNALPPGDVADLHRRGPNDLFSRSTTELALCRHEGLQNEIVSNEGVVAVGDVTMRSLTLIAEKSPSGDTELESLVFAHDTATSERVCVAESLQTVDEGETFCEARLRLCTAEAPGAEHRAVQTCVRYSADAVAISCVSPGGGSGTSTVNFDGLSFDSDEAAVVLGPFSEFRIKYDDGTDTLQIQHLDDGVYTTKVEYGR